MDVVLRAMRALNICKSLNLRKQESYLEVFFLKKWPSRLSSEWRIGTEKLLSFVCWKYDTLLLLRTRNVGAYFFEFKKSRRDFDAAPFMKEEVIILSQGVADCLKDIGATSNKRSWSRVFPQKRLLVSNTPKKQTASGGSCAFSNALIDLFVAAIILQMSSVWGFLK